ncbi:GNAT family N-acetyltransferase [Candidatus Sumerlaeota bacterium]|nr:GNAT family N-acetyltransferase [Candidatus Sumerlaeota bacterium]
MSLKDRLGEFPVLETERLLLRETMPEKDFQAHYLLWSDPEAMKFLPHPLLKSEEEALEKLRILKERYYDETYVLAWTIALKENNNYIGGIRYFSFFGYNYMIGEIGYELAREQWNKGFMTEALRAAVKYGFDSLGLNRIQLTIRPENKASSRMAEKSGFSREGLLRDWEYDTQKNKWRDMLMFSMLRSVK